MLEAPQGGSNDHDRWQELNPREPEPGGIEVKYAHELWTKLGKTRSRG
jgi:hypothetical protein